MPKLPRTAWVWGIAGLAVILVFVVFSYSTTTTNPQKDLEGGGGVEKNVAIKQLITAQFTDKDTDGDGLHDWEESLWSTDPNDIDTDGDGTTDGDEVDQNRDPTIPGPDDKRDILPDSNTTQGGEKTATEIYAQQFFADYLTLKQDGQLNSPSRVDFLLQNIDEAFPLVDETQYQESDLVIVPNSSNAVRRFGNQAGDVLRNYGDIGDENAFTIIENAIINDQREEIVKLDPIIASYSNIAKHLLTVPVPKRGALYHLAFINSLQAAHDSLLRIRNVFEDPLSAVTSLEDYQVSAREVAGAMLTLQDYFSQENVVFENTENGYILTHLPF